MFISFAPPKEMNQRIRGRKRKIQGFCPPAAQGRDGATKNPEFHTVSGFALAHFTAGTDLASPGLNR
jgi:hypothetical protein